MLALARPGDSRSAFVHNARNVLLSGLNYEQATAVQCNARRMLLVAGAGSGKTEVMSRKVAWWLVVDGVPRENVVAFTFTEAAAEELKFRIRSSIEELTLPGQASVLDGMYIGTIHGFCLKKLREFDPDQYYSFDVCDELTRFSLVERAANFVLGIGGFKAALSADASRQVGLYDALRQFLRAYDLLHEHDAFAAELCTDPLPSDIGGEQEWCKAARLLTDVGSSRTALTFSTCAARFYAYMRARRFLDFATSQTELTRLIRGSAALQTQLRETRTHLVVDEAQDVNPVQRAIIELFVNETGKLTAVGDHRQAIYAFRGGRVELMGELSAELDAAPDGVVLALPTNYRSTGRIVEVANRWSQTIGVVPGLNNPTMRHGNTSRTDQHQRHVAIGAFPSRAEEATWLARSIKVLVPNQEVGARHDNGPAESRGLTYADVAVLVRSGTSVREYQDALIAQGIPVVVRAGADLFAQPEVLLLLACLTKAGKSDTFYGGEITRAIKINLACAPTPDDVIETACAKLRLRGLKVERDTAKRLKTLASAIAYRLTVGEKRPPTRVLVNELRTPEARDWCRKADVPRRVFPQTLLHWFFAEAGIRAWDDGDPIGQTAMFHLGQLSSLVKGLETPGWTRANDFSYQVSALINWGAKSAKPEDAPLLVAPNAVTISTVHGAKGLQFAAVFVVDAASQRFPSKFARKADPTPFDGPILSTINSQHLCDNDNLDAERRLMYVALTRAERFAFVSCSGKKSFFLNELEPIMCAEGGSTELDARLLASTVVLETSSRRRDDRLTTSFSNLRFYLECPHDFYLRKVLGFAPAINQAFGYGRAVHNMLRQIHTKPKAWAALSPADLKTKIDRLVRSPGFYLRYTTGEPLENMRRAASESLVRYVVSFRGELASLKFEPEREFETLVAEENVMIAGAIDLVRLDEPPRVTIVDFKSGSAGTGDGGLSEAMMKLQLGIYGLAAASELEYEPERGQVRFLAEQSPDKRQIEVDFSDGMLQEARASVVRSPGAIRRRRFRIGPAIGNETRCTTCDHANVCGLR